MTPDESQPEPSSVSIPLHDLLSLSFAYPMDSEGRAEVRMPVRAEALGFTGSLHGGAIATMIDLACALAAAGISNFDPMRESLVTADMHIRYLGRPRTDEVIAKAEVVKKGRQQIIVACDVVDENEHRIAVADFSMMIVPLRTPLREQPEGPSGQPEL